MVGMTMNRVLYAGILVVLALLVAIFFVFAANVDQSVPTIALCWLVAILSLQTGKLLRHR